MNVVHTVASIAKKNGGPSRSVTALCDALSQLNGIGVNLLTQQYRNQAEVELPEDVRINIERVRSNSSFLLRSGVYFRNSLKRVVNENKPQILNDHGMWLPTNHFVSVLSKKMNIKRVVHPRGMIQPWARSYKGNKKALAYWLYQRQDLLDANMFVATSDLEAENIRKCNLKQPIAVLPNGVDIKLDSSFPDTLNKESKTDRTLLFLSRVHPVKGILNLLDAWKIVKANGWKLIIAGPDEEDHLSDVVKRIKDLDLFSTVEVIGEVEGEIKSRLYKEADLFILPSYSENFGLVVAEALAYGVPVITTTGTPWSQLPNQNCGWYVEPNVTSLVGALREAIDLSREELQHMGREGVKYAQDFEWSSIAERTLHAYQWLLGNEERPAFVYLD